MHVICTTNRIYTDWNILFFFSFLWFQKAEWVIEIKCLLLYLQHQTEQWEGRLSFQQPVVQPSCRYLWRWSPKIQAKQRFQKAEQTSTGKLLMIIIIILKSHQYQPPILTFTPCRSLLGTGGATTASLVLMIGTIFIRSSSCRVLFRLRRFCSSWKSRLVTRTWKNK